MLSALRTRIVSQLPRTLPSRSYTEAAPVKTTSSPESFSSPVPPPKHTKKYPYLVPRNKNGNLPVYSDVRNAGGRYLVLIRNVEGNVAALARDLTESLFEKDSYETSRMKMQVLQARHVVIQAGSCKNQVIEWLRQRGF